MEALEIESQTDQTPLASRRLDPTQGELAEAQHLFDDPDHRFDGAFACPIDRFAQHRPELVRHLDLGACILGRRIGERCEPLLPTGMMGITVSCNFECSTHALKYTIIDREGLLLSDKLLEMYREDLVNKIPMHWLISLPCLCLVRYISSVAGQVQHTFI